MSRRVIDFIKVKSILAPQDFSIVSSQRARHTELTRILSTSLPTIDFDKYKQVLENTQVVNEVQNALQSFKPNALNVDLVLKDLEEQKEKAVENARETVKQVHSTVETFKNDLEGLNNLQHFDQLKPEDVYEAAPGLENVYHDRLRDGKVFHDDHNFGERHFG